jgi:hypothetical protein
VDKIWVEDFDANAAKRLVDHEALRAQSGENLQVAAAVQDRVEVSGRGGGTVSGFWVVVDLEEVRALHNGVAGVELCPWNSDLSAGVEHGNSARVVGRQCVDVHWAVLAV